MMENDAFRFNVEKCSRHYFACAMDLFTIDFVFIVPIAGFLAEDSSRIPDGQTYLNYSKSYISRRIFSFHGKAKINFSRCKEFIFRNLVTYSTLVSFFYPCLQHEFLRISAILGYLGPLCKVFARSICDYLYRDFLSRNIE